MKVNQILPFDSSLLEVSISLRQLEVISQQICSSLKVSEAQELIWALKALTLTDLTTLAGDDTASNVARLCQRAAYPFSKNLLQKVVSTNMLPDIHTAAVCVYPARVSDAYGTLQKLGKQDSISVAAVATGFPSGQYLLKTRLEEIEDAIENGATEIDIVINRQLSLMEDWVGVYNEVCAMRKVCSDRTHLKTILAIGELGTMENVYKAAMCCMLAGADFIKTSTGKETVNATLPVGLAMIYAIQTFQNKTGQRVGLKPAGGVKTVREAISWMILVRQTLGWQYLSPNLFRFGASGLLDDIEKVVHKTVPKK